MAKIFVYNGLQDSSLDLDFHVGDADVYSDLLHFQLLLNLCSVLVNLIDLTDVYIIFVESIKVEV